MDTTPIVARLSVIANSIHALRELKQLTFEDFSSDQILQAAAERHFQVAIQAALDIGSTILAALSHKVPETYRDIFPQLADVGILPADFAQHIAGMAQFRNVLVHMYLEVDVNQLYNYLQQNIQDLELFAQYIGNYLAD